MYNRMERDKERDNETLSDKVKQGSKDILRRMDKQETCTEDSKGRTYGIVRHSGTGNDRNK